MQTWNWFYSLLWKQELQEYTHEVDMNFELEKAGLVLCWMEYVIRLHGGFGAQVKLGRADTLGGDVGKHLGVGDRVHNAVVLEDDPTEVGVKSSERCGLSLMGRGFIGKVLVK